MASSADAPQTWQERDRRKSFPRLSHDFFKHPAIRTLDPISRAVMMRVAEEFRLFNNGHLHLSIRTAQADCQLGSKNSAVKAFAILQERGIIRLTWKGRRINSTGQKIGSAWEFTEFPMRDDLNEEVEPSRDYLRWSVASGAVPIEGAQEPEDIGYAPAKRKSRAKPKVETTTIHHSAEMAELIRKAKAGEPIEDLDDPFEPGHKPVAAWHGDDDDVPF